MHPKLCKSLSGYNNINLILNILKDEYTVHKINSTDDCLEVTIYLLLYLPLHQWTCSTSQDTRPPSSLTYSQFYLLLIRRESVDKWRRCALGLSRLRSGQAIYERALRGLNVINRRRPPRPQAGQGQPTLHCLDREITSKQPAACVKKILHSGSAQMNPGGAWNSF